MPLDATLLPALLGFGTGLALIVAIGAQNAYLLRLGIGAPSRVVLVAVLICALSDAILITAGVAGVGALIETVPVALAAVRVVGAGFLIVYGLFAAYRVFRPKALVAASDPAPIRVAPAALSVLALTWLNPHVYLDTLVFLGSLANQQGADSRWWWAAGAVTASFAWFFALGFGARLLRRFFARPSSWRILDALIAAVMLALGLRLAIGG